MRVSVILVFILRWLYAFFVIAVAVAVIIVNGDVRTVTVYRPNDRLIFALDETKFHYF